MELRDEIAVKVLPSIMRIMDEYAKRKRVTVEEIDVAITAYKYADAMLKARAI